MEERAAYQDTVHGVADRRIAQGGVVKQVAQVLQVQKTLKNPPSQTDPYENVWVLVASYAAPTSTPPDPRTTPPLVQSGAGDWTVGWSAATWGIETAYDVEVEWTVNGVGQGSDMVGQAQGHVTRSYDVTDTVTARLRYRDTQSNLDGPWVDAVGPPAGGGSDTPPATPAGAPSAVSLTASTGAVNATWSNDSSTRTSITIEWYSKPALTQTYSLLDTQTLASTATSAGHTATAGDSVYCRLRYVNDGVAGAWSANSNEVVVPDPSSGSGGGSVPPPTQT